MPGGSGNEVRSDKMLIEDERGELRICDGKVTSVMSNSTISGGNQHMLATAAVPTARQRQTR